MNYFAIVVAVACFTSSVLSYPRVYTQGNSYGDTVQLVPLRRIRRSGCVNHSSDGTKQVYGNICITDPGRYTVGIKDVPLNTANHKVQTHVFATDSVKHHSPLKTGVEGSYLHKPSQSTFEASVIRAEQLGTDFSLSGKYNFFQDKKSNVNVEGFASKHVGGLSGNQPTDYGVKVNVNAQF